MEMESRTYRDERYERCPDCGTIVCLDKPMTLAERIMHELYVESTPSELAAVLDAPVRSVRAALYHLREDERVQRLDTKRGKEFFWDAV